MGGAIVIPFDDDLPMPPIGGRLGGKTSLANEGRIGSSTLTRASALVG
jgi:hypothetical protein